MLIMKRMWITFVIFGFGMFKTQAQIGYGVKTGLNLAKYSQVADVLQKYQKNNLSYFVTAYADFPITSQFSIQPGISLQGKGAKYSGEAEGSEFALTQNVMSLELPLNAVYYFPTGSGHVFLGVGPYIGFNISGKQQGEGALNQMFTGSSTRKMSFSGEERQMNMIDAGLNFLAGYKLYNGILLHVGYGLGLSNLTPDKDQKNSSNRVISFGVGFQF